MYPLPLTTPLQSVQEELSPPQTPHSSKIAEPPRIPLQSSKTPIESNTTEFKNSQGLTSSE